MNILFPSSPARLPSHFHLAQRCTALMTVLLGAVAIIFLYAAMTISDGHWIFGPVVILSTSMGAWLHFNAADKTLIFSVTEAGVSSEYWSSGLLPWKDILSFEIKEIYFEGIGTVCFLDFRLHEQEKHGHYSPQSHLATVPRSNASLSIPLAFVEFKASKLKHLLQTQIDKARPTTLKLVVSA